MDVLIVRSFKWKKGAGLWYTICPKCLCKGYALGLSHSMLHDCSLHLRFHFALWYRKPCIEACSSAASLQWPHWGRDPERMHGARTKTTDTNKICLKPMDIPFWIGLVNMQSTIHCCLRGIIKCVTAWKLGCAEQPWIIFFSFFLTTITCCFNLAHLASLTS